MPVGGNPQEKTSRSVIHERKPLLRPPSPVGGKSGGTAEGVAGALVGNARDNRAREHAPCPWKDVKGLANNLAHGAGAAWIFYSLRSYGDEDSARAAMSLAVEKLAGLKKMEILSSSVTGRRGAGFGFTLNYRYPEELRFYFPALPLADAAAASNGLSLQRKFLETGGASVKAAGVRRMPDGHFTYMIAYISRH